MFLERMSHNFLLEESQNLDLEQIFGGAAQIGGIGSFAINYGQGQHYQDIVNVCVIVLLVGVCIIQAIGSFIAKKTSNRAFIQKTYKKMD